MNLQAVFSALSDPTRRQVLQILSTRGPATATELAGELPVSRQAVVKHLDALDAAGLLDRHREGRQVRFRVTPQPLTGAVRWILEVGSEWDERMDRLGGLLEERPRR
jgi:DNA-binding transcriptional ArsR family regulator